MQEDKEKTKQPGTLTRRQECALLALIEGSSLSLSEVAKKISVNPSTLWRWRTQDEAFKQKYREMRRGLVEAHISRLQGLMDAAISTLEKNLSTGNRPSECRAASTIIRQGIEGVDALDFEERISAIEKRFNTGKVK
jgi:transposase-like protein